MATQSPRFAGFTLRTECPQCGMPLPLDRPEQKVTCSRCQSRVSIPGEVWRHTLYVFEGCDGPRPGTAQDFSATVAGLSLRGQVSGSIPTCEKCGTAFPVDALALETCNFSCVSCGDPASTAPAPPWLRELVPTARQVFMVDARTDVGAGAGLEAQVDVEAPRPVLMSCPQCGATLRITADHARVSPCEYCRADVFLPDDLWRRLHPIRTVRWWYVRFDGTTPEQWALQQQEEAEREESRQSEEQRREEEASFYARVESARPYYVAAWGTLALFVLAHVANAIMVIAGVGIWGTVGVVTLVGLTGATGLVVFPLAGMPKAMIDETKLAWNLLTWWVFALICAIPVVNLLLAGLAVKWIAEADATKPGGRHEYPFQLAVIVQTAALWVLMIVRE